MSEDHLVKFGRFCFRDAPAQPDIPGAVEYAVRHPEVLPDEGLGGPLNIVIRSRAPSSTKLDAVKKLIEVGAKPEGPSPESDTLSSAVSANELGIARFLLTKIDISAVNASEYSPLALAIHYGNLDMVKLLVEAGMNPGKKHGDMTMIARARWYGHKHIEEYLKSKCTPEQLAAEPEAGSFADVAARGFPAIQKSVGHVLLGVTVHFTGDMLITEGLGGESPDGAKIEIFMMIREDVSEDWALNIVLAGVDGLRSGKGIASDIGEIVPIANVPNCAYSHLLLLRDKKIERFQFFRAFPIYKNEAKFAVKSGARALVEKFQLKGVPGSASPERHPAV